MIILPRGWLTPINRRTGLMIREILYTSGSLSIYDVWKKILGELEGYKKRYVPPSISSIYTYFWALRKLGLVRVIGHPPTKKRGWIRRALHEIVPGQEDSWFWENPLLAVRDLNKFRQTRSTPKPVFMYSELPMKDILESRDWFVRVLPKLKRRVRD